MDDYVVSNLNESKNEWAMRLVNILAPLVIEGLRSIFSEADRLCIENNEEEKYLMTFQNLLANIPNWSATTVESETTRITERSGCGYLPDLISCVHVIQLKILTCVRVGKNTKPIAIDIPSFDKFIHKVYINLARQLYSNIYLFEKDIQPLSVQKNNRELEIITRDCILNTVRENIPVESILKAYLAETEEEIENDVPDMEKTVQDGAQSGDHHTDVSDEQSLTESQRKELAVSTQTSPISSPSLVSTTSLDVQPVAVPTAHPVTSQADIAQVSSTSATQPNVSATALSFSDTDMAIDTDKQIESIHAPKTIERLEEISSQRAQDDDDDDERIEILGDSVKLDILDVNDLRAPTQPKPPALSGVEILE